MKKLFLYLFASFFISTHGYASSLLKLDSNSNYSQQQITTINLFLNQVEKKLPSVLVEKLSEQRDAIFVSFDDIKGESTLKAPSCKIVDSFAAANEAENNFSKAQMRVRTYLIHFNDQILSYIKNGKIIMHKDFVSVIMSGESKAETYNCGHRNMYRLAEASLIHDMALMFDNPRLVEDRNDSRLKKLVSDFSETQKYRFVSGWDNKKKLQAFWPRALNPYEYAGDVPDHFAYNLEYFLLDSEYACRKPLQQDYFSRIFFQSNKYFDPFLTSRTCSVNYHLILPLADQINGDNPKIVRANALSYLADYDLNPKNIFNIYYLRAGAGAGSGGLGHSMWRFVVCGHDEEKESQARAHGDNTDYYLPLNQKCEENPNDMDLIVNPRANPLEMKLDTMKGLKGNYPSMFLMSPASEIYNEYAHKEFRNLYSIPLIGKNYVDSNGTHVNVVADDVKIRMIWATLDQYWDYYGRYKFVSNNCADETMRLYQMASENEDVWNIRYAFYQQPSDINAKLSKLHLADQVDTDKLESHHGFLSLIFKKDMRWDDFVREYQKNVNSYNNSKKTYLSRNFDVLSEIRDILLLEGIPEKDLNSVKKVTSKADIFLKLAEPNEDWKKVDISNFSEITQKERENFIPEFFKIEQLYKNLMSKTNDLEFKKRVTQNFYGLIYYIQQKRIEAMSNYVVQLGYSIAYSDKLPKGVVITPENKNSIKEAIEKYAEIERKLMPYRETSVVGGYGIPLRSEEVRGQKFVDLMVDKSDAYSEVMNAMGAVLNSSYLIRDEIAVFLKQMEPFLPANSLQSYKNKFN